LVGHERFFTSAHAGLRRSIDREMHTRVFISS
jgi:hypothetical protein